MNFSRVSLAVILHSNTCSELIFENFIRKISTAIHLQLSTSVLQESLKTPPCSHFTQKRQNATDFCEFCSDLTYENLHQQNQCRSSCGRWGRWWNRARNITDNALSRQRSKEATTGRWLRIWKTCALALCKRWCAGIRWNVKQKNQFTTRFAEWDLNSAHSEINV